MKFETILDAYFRTIEDVAGERIYDEYIPLRIRQRDAFRARLERMYKLKGATSLERAMGRACDELGLDYIFIDEIVSDPLPRG